jgi:hypothetical protein
LLFLMVLEGLLNFPYPVAVILAVEGSGQRIFKVFQQLLHVPAQPFATTRR